MSNAPQISARNGNGVVVRQFIGSGVEILIPRCGEMAVEVEVDGPAYIRFWSIDDAVKLRDGLDAYLTMYDRSKL